MSAIGYTRYELLRTFRNRRFAFLSLGFPVAFYWLLAAPQRNDHNFAHSGLSVPLYYMVGLAAFGTMVAMLSAGGRIAGEREAGWTRQLRISPLSVRAYFRAKVLTAYATALLTLTLLCISGVVLGVSLPAGRWVAMISLILVGLLPFAALGILIGHLVTTDSVGPAIGGGVSILAFLGGTWFPITSGFLHTLGPFVPSWWLVQASHVAIGGQAWGVRGWVTIAVWTALLSAGAAWAYRRDTARV